jgi:hypothetical protein
MEIIKKSTLLSRVHERFAHEIYQDFQEYIYERFRKPSSIVMRLSGNTVRSCFPRSWGRGFCDFCKYLRETSPIPFSESVCVEQQEKYIKDGIIAEEEGKKWKWDWRTCHMGLIDFFIPIRSSADLNSHQSILAVLIIGHYRLPQPKYIQFIHSRVDEITTGNDCEKYYPNISIHVRKKHNKQLHILAEKIPVIDEITWKKNESNIKEAVALMEVIATRTLHKSILLKGEEFIQSLGINMTNINIGEKKLWSNVENSFLKIMNYLEFDTAAIYASYYSDYSDMKCQFFLPPLGNRPTSLGLPSYGSFKWLEKKKISTFPTYNDHFSWLNPKTFFKAKYAIIFASEMHNDHLIIAGFGINKEIKSFQKIILYETINNHIFRFIENALFGITLDNLMVETGHLMGRAYGKIAIGSNQLKKFSLHNWKKDQEEILQDAFWTIEDGVTRLELIKANFYSFRSHRLGAAEDVDFEETTGKYEVPEILKQYEIEDGKIQIDIVAVLKNLKNYFDRIIRDKHLKPIQYSIDCNEAIIEAPPDGENKLKLVFLNLFDNAVKFAYENTFIKIQIKKELKSCRIHFENLGIGVASDEFERVFYRLTKSRYKNPFKRIEGLGLGLPHCRRIIEGGFSGTISLQSYEAYTPNLRRFEGDNWITIVTVNLSTIK